MNAHRLLSTLVVFGMLAALIGCGADEAPPAEEAAPARPRLSEMKPPVIDGNLDDPCWTDALHLTDFTKPKSDAKPANTVEAWVTCDEKTLYVAAKCAAPDPSKIRADVTVENDNVWQDDAVEVFVRMTGDMLEHDQFIVNSIGTRGWHRLRSKPTGDAWKPAFVAKAAVGNDAWTVEFAIPMSDLDAEALKPGDTFAFKIGCGGASVWPPGARYAGPDDYATLAVANAVPRLKVTGAKAPDVVGPAIPVKADAEKPTVVKKLLVTDCRAVRGFLGTPVDGSTKSWGWDAGHYEYNRRRSNAGVLYDYRNNDGLHITLADADGINAVQVRGGVRAKLYRDCPSWQGPEGGTLVATLRGGTLGTTRVWFEKPVATDSLSFYDVGDGTISDVSFFRISAGADALPEPERVEATLTDKNTVSIPLKDETPLAALGLDLALEGETKSFDLCVVMTDPVDARRELVVADLAVDKPGHLKIVLDFPDQIIPAGGKLDLALHAPDGVKIASAALDLYKVKREEAVPEALAYRKLLLHGMYCAMSEARPWNAWHYRDKVEAWFKSDARNVSCVKNLLDALDHCRYLDPQGRDDEVRQYYEWIWRHVLRKEKKTPPFKARFDSVAGAPEWAALARQAWLQARAVPQWWLRNRLVPTGEFGGVVGDDSDMYQNYANFVAFETDGVAAQLKNAAARLAELAYDTCMVEGINRRTMDPLHAYEEGLNQDALLAFWNYGDPVTLERCMDSARSVERCTVLTEKGHRHFRSQEIGADRRDNDHTDVDGHAHPLMWHPTFEVVRYNANPTAMKWLREWGDGWLEHITAKKYAHSVTVATEKVAGTHEFPLYGGYGGQGSAFESLYWVTGEKKYLAPFMDVYRGKENFRTSPGAMVAELYQRGAFDKFKKADALLKSDPVAYAQATGDTGPLVDALKRDITELQRYGMLYTTVEPFTDRVFLRAIITASKCYTGGFATRNKYCRTHAVSYEGFGTDYAALVMTARGDRFKVLIYNFADRELKGNIRPWTLDHGRYALTQGVGPDERKETIEVVRGTPIAVTLPSRKLTAIELVQTKKLDDIRTRADLALSTLDTKLRGGVIEGVAHNIGSKDVENVVVALVDADGKMQQRKDLGKLAAPIDLVPKRVAFRFDALPANAAGWSVVIDPEETVKEITEGNNRVKFR